MRKSKGNNSGRRGFLRILFGRTMIILVLLVIHFLITFAVLFHLVQFVPYYLGSELALTAIMLVIILNTREEPTVKLTWCVLIALLPVFGTMLYWFARFDLGHRLHKRAVQRTVLESREHAPDQTEVLQTLRREEPDFYGIASYLSRHCGLGIGRNTQVTYFPVGEEKLKAMLAELEKAEKYIYLEYFIIAQGQMWDAVLEVLKRKAAQGVEVRVLYDGTCAVTNLPYGYPKKLRKMGIQCKMFAPLRPFVSTHYNNRDHRKILVIDGVTAFTGGINLSDEYVNITHPYGHWKDTAVMLRGDSAASFTLMFLQMWNAEEKIREYDIRLPTPQTQTGEGYVIPYGDIPTDTERVGEMVYLDMLHKARDYVYIMTPYLILDDTMLTALKLAVGRGVDVRLILPRVPDHIYATVLARRHYKELLDAGVKLYTYTPGFLHAKVFLSDDTKAVVGTINLDYRSLYLHYECAAYLYKVPAIADIHRDFLQTFDCSHPMTMEDVRKESFLSRLFGVLLKALAPLM